MLKKRFFVLLLIVVLLAPMSALAQDGGDKVWPTDGWPTSTPEDEGMSSDELAAFFETWSQEHFNLDNLVFIRNGHIIAEAYPAPRQADIIHHMYSASKSVTGALIGVLIQDGYLEGVDVPVLSIFPDRTFENVDALKESMTVEDVLMMSAGLECHDLSANWATSGEMESTDDWLQAALDLPMAVEPGTELNYCNPFTHILSAIITEKTGMSALDYAAEKLFAPLGITQYAWSESPSGVSYGYSELQLTARDMAKIGYLYLNSGEWEGQQIMPADYAEASITTQIESPLGTYGYKWWTLDAVNISLALGWGRQYIIVEPEKNIIVALTGGFSESISIPLHTFPLAFGIAELSVSDEPLPENPEGLSKLEATIEAINNPEAQQVPPMPKMAESVSGQVYNLLSPKLLTVGQERRLGARRHTGMLDTKALSVTFDGSDEALLTVVFADEEVWEIPVGLDDLYRVTEGRLTVGAKGEWITKDTFRVYLKHIGNALLYELDINFVPGAVRIVSHEYAQGAAEVIPGMAAQ